MPGSGALLLLLSGLLLGGGAVGLLVLGGGLRAAGGERVARGGRVARSAHGLLIFFNQGGLQLYELLLAGNLQLKEVYRVKGGEQPVYYQGDKIKAEKGYIARTALQRHYKIGAAGQQQGQDKAAAQSGYIYGPGFFIPSA